MTHFALPISFSLLVCLNSAMAMYQEDGKEETYIVNSVTSSSNNSIVSAADQKGLSSYEALLELVEFRLTYTDVSPERALTDGTLAPNGLSAEKFRALEVSDNAFLSNFLGLVERRLRGVVKETDLPIDRAFKLMSIMLEKDILADGGLHYLMGKLGFLYPQFVDAEQIVTYFNKAGDIDNCLFSEGHWDREYYTYFAELAGMRYAVMMNAESGLDFDKYQELLRKQLNELKELKSGDLDDNLYNILEYLASQKVKSSNKKI